jgi:hypothetical protein
MQIQLAWYIVYVGKLYLKMLLFQVHCNRIVMLWVSVGHELDFRLDVTFW